MLKERLVKLRTDKGLSQYELAKILNLSRGQISNYELGSRQPDYDTLIKIADFFSVTTDYLLGRDDNGLISELPLLGTIHAGLPILADENIEGYLEVPEHIRADYILRVQGDSMIGVGILDGDYAVCKEAQAAFSGQIVVSLRDQAVGISEATLKFFFDNGHGTVLRAANPQYADMDMKEGYRIAGVMVGMIRQEAPNYQLYRNFLAVNDSEEWTRVIETALDKSMTPKDIIYMIDMQTRISERMLQKKQNPPLARRIRTSKTEL